MSTLTTHLQLKKPSLTDNVSLNDIDDNYDLIDAAIAALDTPNRLQFTDTVVATTAFMADTTYEDFPYRAAIALTGVLATMTPEVVLSVADAMSGNIAPVAECYAGGVYIYATEVPETAMTIPTIIAWKAVS